MSTTPGKRKERPNCEVCSHSLSFHGADLGRCKALGCLCAGYVGLTQLGFDTMSIEEAAPLLRMSVEDALAAIDHAELEWVPASMVHTNGAAEMVWRVQRRYMELTAPKNS